MTRPLLVVVDDEPDMASLIADVGTMVGFEPRTAHSAIELQKIVASTSVAAIVLDIVMPDMDGIELLQWLTDRGCAAPILLINGFDPLYLRTARMIGTAKGLQIAGTLAKPIPIAQLQAVLDEVIRRSLPPAVEQEKSKPNQVDAV